MGDFEITPREILASITIIAVMIVVGMVIGNNIDNHILDQNEEYNRAIKIKHDDVFQYGMETNVGNAFVYGKLQPVDTVTYREIGGKYYYIEKIKERYTRHEKEVTETDRKGRKHTRIKVWYSWDKVSSDDKTCKNIIFAGKKFKSDKISFIDDSYIRTIYKWSKVRYKYYGMKAKPIKGTVYTKLKNNTISECKLHRSGLKSTVEQYKEESGSAKFLFWIAWMVFIGVVVYGFYYIDNDWLE